MNSADQCPTEKKNRPDLDPWKNDNQNLIQRLAQTKVFTSIMLNAWRQRRADVRLLNQKVESLQKNAIQFKNELHVSRTLMRLEQKRCKELQLELVKSTLNIRHVRKSFDELSISLYSLKTEKEHLEEELNCFRTQAYKHSISSRSCEELHKALLGQLETSKQLSEQQSQVRRLKSEKARLLEKIFEIENEYWKRKESYVQQLEQKDKELRDMRLTNESLERQLQDRQNNRYELEHDVNNTESTENAWVKSPSSDTQLTQEVDTQVNQRVASKGIRQILSSIQHYTSAALFLLWVTFLPRYPQRYGCTQ